MKNKLIGIDLGGTTAKLAILTEDGEIQHRWSVETNIEDNGSHIVPNIIESIKHSLYLYDMTASYYIRIGM